LSVGKKTPLFLIKLYSILIESHSSIKGDWERQQATLLSSFLLLAIPILVFASFTSDLLVNVASTYSIAIFVVTLFYILTRTHYYKISLVVTLIGFSILPLIIWFFGTTWHSNDIPRLMVWIFIALIAGALLTRTYVVIIQGIIIVFSFVFIVGVVFGLPFSEYDSHLGTVGIIAFFVIVISYILDSYIVQVNNQKDDLSKKQWELEVYTQLLRHDLRNDLHAILGAIELSQLLLDVDVSQVEGHLEQSYRLGERMANLLNVFTLPLEQPDTNLVKHIHDSAHESEKVHKNLTIKINSSSEVENKTFTASRLLPMVWANIFRNAAQYAGDNPIVTVDIFLEADTFHILIGNDGPPIPLNTREHLFTRGGEMGDEEGGLGLYLSKIILESHGGTIKLSESDETQFSIRIPSEREIET